MSKMNTRTEVVDNLLTTTWYDRSRPDVIDGVSKINPFYVKMIENGRIKEKAPDGTHWEYNIRYDRNDQNIQYFGRGSSFGVGEKETLTVLKFEVCNLGTSIIRYWETERKNKGKAKIIDYVQDLIEDTQTGLEEALATDVLAQNADSRSINALPTLISTTPTTGSIGGLTRSEHPFLQNVTYDFTGLTTAAKLLTAMTTVFNKCTEFKGGKKTKAAPDIILTTRQIYQDYEVLADAYRQIVSNTNTSADLGFGNLTFKGIPIFWDPECPSGCMYFLNTSTLEMPYDSDVWFEMTDWKWVDGTQLDRTAQILCVMNLICKFPAKNGVIHAITATST